MSKDRLEEAKDNSLLYRRTVGGVVKEEYKKVPLKEYNYFIEQAEQVQQLESEKQNLHKYNVGCINQIRELYLQNKRYRELLESIRYTPEMAKEIQAEKPNIKIITPDDLLQHMLRKVNKALERDDQ